MYSYVGLLLVLFGFVHEPVPEKGSLLFKSGVGSGLVVVAFSCFGYGD